ncbi:MAG TPA: hypothetical protein VLQ80_01620 [Candidatus Saccharimonadia bacterium]|nr:hypothetical protein [Candidatus Saccharimonadia bacterium]
MSTEAVSSTPRRWRKKPVVIEAVHFTPELALQWLNKEAPVPFGLTVSGSWHPTDRKLYSALIGIDTLEGKMTARLGDWIIKGVKGELYPCKPEIFEATYEPA